MQYSSIILSTNTAIWWEILLNVLVAIGTVGSAITATYLAIKANQPKLSVFILWDSTTNYIPTVSVKNIGAKPIYIEHIIVKFGNELIDDCVSDQTINNLDGIYVDIGSSKQITLNMEKLQAVNSKTPEKRKALNVTVVDIYNRRFSSNRSYSVTEMKHKSFPAAFQSEIGSECL